MNKREIYLFDGTKADIYFKNVDNGYKITVITNKTIDDILDLFNEIKGIMEGDFKYKEFVYIYNSFLLNYLFNNIIIRDLSGSRFILPEPKITLNKDLGIIKEVSFDCKFGNPFRRTMVN